MTKRRVILWLAQWCEALRWRGLSLTLFLWGQRRGWIPVFAGGVDTAVASGAAEVAEIWSKDIWVEYLEKMWWTPYIEDAYQLIRVDLQYGLPKNKKAEKLLHILCAKLLEFEKYYVRIYNEYMARK